MTTTKHFNLIKPQLTDPADITSFEYNWERIELELLNADKVFLAEYGVTPPEDVIRAIESGKFVYCRKDQYVMPLCFNRTDLIMFSSMQGCEGLGGFYTEAYIDTGTLFNTAPTWKFREKEAPKLVYKVTDEDLVAGESQLMTGYLCLVYE